MHVMPISFFTVERRKHRETRIKTGAGKARTARIELENVLERVRLRGLLGPATDGGRRSRRRDPSCGPRAAGGRKMRGTTMMWPMMFCLARSQVASLSSAAVIVRGVALALRVAEGGADAGGDLPRGGGAAKLPVPPIGAAALVVAEEAAHVVADDQ